MHLQTYCVYLTALTGSMLTPGPAMLQALTLGMRHGARPVAFVALGNGCVTVIQVMAALVGLSFLAAKPWLLHLAGLAGAGYIAWLGLALWRGARAVSLDAVRDETARPSWAGLALQGALVASVNPKAWGFLAALLPPFATEAMPPAETVVLLAAPIVILATGGMMAYAVFGSRLSRLLTTPRAMRRFLRSTAVVLWLCSVALATR